jgi:hypothetical protein
MSRFERGRQIAAPDGTSAAGSRRGLIGRGNPVLEIDAVA